MNLLPTIMTSKYLASSSGHGPERPFWSLKRGLWILTIMKQCNLKNMLSLLHSLLVPQLSTLRMSVSVSWGKRKTSEHLPKIYTQRLVNFKPERPLYELLERNTCPVHAFQAVCRRVQSGAKWNLTCNYQWQFKCFCFEMKLWPQMTFNLYNAIGFIT